MANHLQISESFYKDYWEILDTTSQKNLTWIIWSVRGWGICLKIRHWFVRTFGHSGRKNLRKEDAMSNSKVSVVSSTFRILMKRSTSIELAGQESTGYADLTDGNSLWFPWKLLVLTYWGTCYWKQQPFWTPLLVTVSTTLGTHLFVIWTRFPPFTSQPMKQ